MYLHHTALNLKNGKWQALSLAEQMGNIGSEISRALNWKEKDEKLFEKAIERALELLDFTISDPRWQKRLKEIVRVREFICDAVFGDKKYGNSLEDFDQYFLSFALLARAQK